MTALAIATHTTPTDSIVLYQRDILKHAPSIDQPLTDAAHWLLDPRNVRGAWDRVSSTSGANTPGPDGQICSEIEPRLDRWLKPLCERVAQQTFQPAPPRLVEFPKPKGGTRSIGVLNITDRVVQSLIKQLLEPLCERFFLPSSFGFRPGHSVPNALAEAAFRCTGSPARFKASGSAAARSRSFPPLEVAVHLDVRKCFDEIDHQLLMQAVRRVVADPLIDALLASILSVSGTSTGWLSPRRRGLVQGGSLSPLLCNLFLHPLDQALAQECERSSATALRYADDLCLAAPDKTSLKRLMSVARDQLRQLRLEFGNWPQPASLDDGVEWLGVRLRRTTHPWDRSQTVGFEIPLPKIRHLFEVLDEMTEPPSDRLHGNVFRLGSWVTSLNEQLHQWFEVYGGATNAPEVFRALDEHLKHRFATLLREVTGARGRQVAERHRHQLPRGFWTWEIEGARLVCLPSLAPRCPFRFPRRPPWARRKT